MKQRYEVVFDHKRKSTIDIDGLFRHRIRWRIKTDFVRLNRQKCIDLWCNAHVLASIGLQDDVITTLDFFLSHFLVYSQKLSYVFKTLFHVGFV